MWSTLLRISPILIALFIVCIPLVADYSRAGAPTLHVNVVQAAEGDAASKEISPAVCDGVISCLVSLPKLIWFYGMSAIGAALVYIATIILSLAALLFDWLITHTVIQFGALYGTIKVAVETAWTAFRDIANILIIGIFTFVAISIILGLKEFGQKKMVANVLIVAVLLNFSLLGTKMVIDASNYVAAQIYNAAQLGGTSASATTGGATTQYGIADQFMYLLGVQTAAKTWKTVSDTALAKDSGWAALGHGILLTLVLLGAAVVLFYGSFLLISRMIMLIFLLITSAIAVGSYLIPDWGGSSYGWTAWKSSLIWCTMFAPIIMILLWVTLNVSYAMKGTYKATLGAALSDPAGGSNTEAIFMYLLVLGMLYATFSISSKWSSKIGGFSYAKAVTSTPFAVGGSFLWNRGRNMVSRVAANRQEGVKKNLGEAKLRASRASAWLEKDKFDKLTPSSQRRATAMGMKTQEELAALEQKANKLEELRTSKVNPFETKVGQNVMKELGVAGFAMGGKSESYGAKADKIAKDAAARAEKAALVTDKDKEKMRPEVEAEVRRRHRNEQADAKEARDARQRQLEVAEATLKATKETPEYKEHQDDEKVAQGRVDVMQKTQAAEIKRMINTGNSDDEIKTRMAEHKADLRKEEDKIAVAQKGIKDLEAPVLDKIKEHTDELKKLNKTFADYEDNDTAAKAIKDQTDAILNERGSASGKVAATTAEQIAHRRKTNIIPRALGESPTNDHASKLARSLVEDHVREKKQGGDILKALKAQMESSGGSTPPAAPLTTT